MRRHVAEVGARVGEAALGAAWADVSRNEGTWAGEFPLVRRVAVARSQGV